MTNPASIDSPTYSVARWDECYENNRTRGMVVMQWIPVPNSHDGDGYIELVSRRNGAAYLGAWLAILQVASKCAERGTLLRRNGKPHTAKSIAKITRLDEKLIAETLQILASEDVAWLCQAGGTLPAPSPHPTDEEGRKGREGKGREGKTAAPVVFIESWMNDDDFQAVWAEWVQHRKEIKKTLTPSTIKTQLKKMAKIGISRSMAMIQHTISNGWTGLYEPDAKQTPASTPPTDLVTDDDPSLWEMK